MMTKNEFYKIVQGLKSIYSDPKYIADEFAMDMWYDLLKDLTYDIASKAIRAYMQSEKFPPTPADIRNYALRITSPVSTDMSEIRAWSIVRKALSNGTYGADEEFAKFPEIIKKVVGTPDRLREWAQLDIDEVENVVGSHFMRNYKAQVEIKRKDDVLDDGLSNAIRRMREPDVPLVEEKPISNNTLIGVLEEVATRSDGISESVEEELSKFYMQHG